MAYYFATWRTEFISNSWDFLGKSKSKIDVGHVDPSSPITTIWYIMIGFFTVDLLNYFSIAVKAERIGGFKHIQLMSGVSPLTYWTSNLFFDSSVFLLIMLCRLILFKYFDDFYFFASISQMLLFMCLIILFGISGLLFKYTIDFFTSSDGMYIFFLIFNLISTTLTFSYYKFETAHLDGSYNSTFENILLNMIKYVILLVPPFNFSLTLEKFVMIWRMNYLQIAAGNSSFGFPLMSQQMSPGYQPPRYLEFASKMNPNGMLLEVLYLIVDIVLYAGLVCIIEQGYIARLLNIKIQSNHQNESIRNIQIEEDVKAERRLVSELTSDIKADVVTENVLLVEELKKIYVSVFGPPVTAVVDVTFRVRSGECFGLLGLNGAGKTTTFKMLTGDVIPTEGNSWLLNISLQKNKNKYLSKCGYCAETFSILEELTGKELLTLVASLRGLGESEKKLAVTKWVSSLGLDAIENNYCGTYSGGEKRKICTALSLIGDPQVVFLDEPTRGADPISRRKLFEIMSNSKSLGQAVILSSHSVQECETLCDRITILARGDMKCIHSPQHLREKYAQGYTIVIKIRNLSEFDLIRRLPELKEAFINEFILSTYELKDEAKSLLQYHIKDQTLLWSEVFSKMERLKAKQDIIEEYTVTETSLEEVFLAFAKPPKVNDTEDFDVTK